MAWFQDGTRLLAAGPAGPEDATGIWIISTLSGAMRKLRDDARGAWASPNGSLIAFLNGREDEVWLMGAGGEEPRRLMKAEEGDRFVRLQWSPDGQRVAYMRVRHASGEASIESRDLQGGKPAVVLSNRRLKSFCWAPDGRIIYALAEPPPNETSFNLWEIPTDPRTGRASGESRRITDWAGVSFLYLSISADGRRIAFVRGFQQSDIYVGELQSRGTALSPPQRLTLDDRIDWLGGWTRDARAVLLFSDRRGQFDIYRQGLKDREAEPLVVGPDEKRSPQLSPDGSSILYLAWPQTKDGSPPSSGHLMRIPVSGGAAEVVLNVRGYPGTARIVSERRELLHSLGYPAFRCASVPGKPCVLGEAAGKQVAFSTFDPADGSKRELARVDLVPSYRSFWDLSADGARIVYGSRESNRLHILSLTDGTTREIAVRGWTHPASVAWSTKGDALFVSDWVSRGGTLLHVSLEGEARILYKSPRSSFDRMVASPDGRYLAFAEGTGEANAWLVEGLR